MSVNTGENLNIRCLQAFNLVPEMGRLCLATRSLIPVATRQVGKYLSHLQQNMLFLVKSNPEFAS